MVPHVITSINCWPMSCLPEELLMQGRGQGRVGGGGGVQARGGDLTILNLKMFYQIPQGRKLMSIQSVKKATPWGIKNLNKQ